MSNTTPANSEISSVPAARCYLCDADGIKLYDELSDQWFGTPGTWNLKRCTNPECGLVWLDPMPSKADIWKAYRSYFTHKDYSPETHRPETNPFDKLTLVLLKLVYKFIMRVSGFRTKEKMWRAKGDTMFLGKSDTGLRLLDVGCGKGDFIVRMRENGWKVEGLEVDADAVNYAQSNYGLTVHLGSLESFRFPDESFDVITLNHVIEHVHDPISLVRECLRILKSGGRLVLATPNMDSFAHQIFGRNWSHLDPPRHLMLFKMKTLSECVRRAGFDNISSWCVPGYAEGAIPASIERVEKICGAKRSESSKYLEAATLKIRAFYQFFVRKEESVGEEFFLMATKKS